MGEIAFGGADPTKYTGAGVTAPLLMTPYWAVSLDAAFLGASAISAHTLAIIDTGTTHLGAPGTAFQAIVASLPPTPNTARKRAATKWRAASWPCCPRCISPLTAHPSRLRPTSTFYDFGQNCCEIAVFSLDGSGFNGWLLGDTFLRQWYTVFDYTPKRAWPFTRVCEGVNRVSCEGRACTTRSKRTHSLPFDAKF